MLNYKKWIWMLKQIGKSFINYLETGDLEHILDIFRIIWFYAKLTGGGS